MPNPLNESSPKSTLSSRSLTPEILAKSNCSQCHLLRAKIQSMDQSSICSTSSQGSYSRSQTPDSVNCPDHRSTPNTPHHNHLINHKLFSRDSPPSQWLYRRRDRRTGQVMLPNIVPTTDYSSFTRSSRKKKSLVHPGEYSFEKDFDSTIETQIDDLDTSNLAHNDQSTKEENESSLIEKQLTAIEMRLNNHHMTRKMVTLLKNPAFLLSFYFIECFTISLLWFNRIQPEKFIDEQFHHGQTVSYCQGNFTKVNIHSFSFRKLNLFIENIYLVG